MSDRISEPNEVELQHTAQAAREALASSLARLDDRVQHIRSTAVNVTAASGWGLAAACAWWLSFATRPKPTRVDQHWHHRPSLFATVLTTALRTAGVVVTGALLYASYRRARRLALADDTDRERAQDGTKARSLERLPRTF